MLKMRFKRCGRKRQPTYRIVVMSDTTKRDGKTIQELGFYNPITKEIKLDVEIYDKDPISESFTLLVTKIFSIT